MQRIIMHIDVNNAFLSWTAILLLKNGYKYDIRKTNSVIGFEESTRHAIVLSKSTPIKKYGVKTADPIYLARKKCPGLQVYKPNYAFYKKMSDAMFDLIKNYTPDIEIMSIDECFLDYGPIKHLYGDEVAFAHKIKNEIKNKLGFTVNVGVANNKLCAKMASDFIKPNRVHTLFDYEIDKKMKPLPIEDLFFVGKKTAAKLRKLGICTIKDLSVQNPEKLRPFFKNQAYKMVNLANGIDNSLLQTGDVLNKGISNSTTLPRNLIYKEEVYDVLEFLVENLTAELRREKRYALVVRVQLKNIYFKSFTHQRKLENSTNSQSVIFKVAKELCDEMWKDEAIRLVGLSLDGLTDVSIYQQSIFDKDIVLNDKKLDETVDKIKSKYGFNVIDKASISGKKKIRKKY